MKKDVNPARAVSRPGHFSALLVSIVLVFALRPFLQDLTRLNSLTDIFLSILVLAAIHAVRPGRFAFVVALTLAVAYFVLQWSSYLVSDPSVDKFAKLAGGLFAAYIFVLTLSFLMSERDVTAEVIKAAVCGYFMLGLAWGYFFRLLESLQPGSFQIAHVGGRELGRFIYFSFVTMTTVGYGDAIPVSSAARSLAVLEAVMGQLYLAVTIARLVGIHAARAEQGRG